RCPHRGPPARCPTPSARPCETSRPRTSADKHPAASTHPPPSLKAPTARVASNIAPAATTRLAPRKARAIRATISRINPVMVHSRVGGERKTAVSVVEVLGAVEEHRLAPGRGQLRHGGVVLDVVEPAGGVVVQVVGDGDAEGG